MSAIKITQERIDFLKEAYKHGCHTEAIGDELFDIINRLTEEMEQARIELEDERERVNVQREDIRTLRAEVQRLRAELARLRAVSVVVPPVDWEAEKRIDQALRRELPAPRKLVPAPPQPSADVVVVPKPPKPEHDCSDCVQLAVCTGALACACGPTGRMFIRREPSTNHDAQDAGEGR